MVPMELYGTGPLKGYAVSNCSHQNQSCNPHKRLHQQVYKVFDHITILPLIQIIQLYGMVMTCHPTVPQLDQGRGQREIWKLTLSLKKFQIWDGHYSNKTNYSLTFNTSTNWTFSIQACVRDPYVLLKGTVSINDHVQELSYQDCKLYTCLNSSLYNSNHSLVILRRRLGIWLPGNQTRPWEGSPEIHALLFFIFYFFNLQ